MIRSGGLRGTRAVLTSESTDSRSLGEDRKVLSVVQFGNAGR